MGIDSIHYPRRDFLAALACLPFMNGRAHASSARERFVACARKADGAFAAAVLDDAGAVSSVLPLPGRGHGAAIAPDGRRAVVFGRRPADFMIAFSMDAPESAVQLSAQAGRHFYGHGCFSSDGRHLFATENAYDDARGVVGVYDAMDRYRRLGEFSSGGVGPHEMILLRDGRTLAVANGGIETHPDFPRRKLNIADMAPNLSYVEAETGALMERAEAPALLHKLSLRHLTQTNDGAVWIGGQYEGPPERRAPLIAIHRRGRALTFITEPSPMAALRNYVGSVASSADGAFAAVTSPRGGVLQVWRAADRRVVAQYGLADICGVSGGQGGFTASDGAGRLWRNDELLAEETGWSWDNHIVAARQL